MKPLTCFRRIVFAALAVVAGLILVPDQHLHADSSDPLKLLEQVPLARAPRAPSPAVSPEMAVGDPRAAAIEGALRSAREGACPPGIENGKKRNRLNQASGADAGPAAYPRNELRRELERETRIHVRTNAGTPRQIKMSPEARRRGVVLERAAAVSGVRRERDEATARAFLRSRRGMLKISDPDAELRVSRYEQDELGRRFVRYSQAWRGLDVWPAELNVHLDPNGNVDLMNGSFVPSPRRMVASPVWSAEQAVRQAREAVSGGDGARAEAPELIVYAPGDRSPRLAWKIRLAVSLEADWLVVIDAADGRLLTSFNRTPNLRIVGAGADVFDQRRSLNVWREGGVHYMIDTDKPMFNPASDFSSINTIRGAIIVFDMENSELPHNGEFHAPIATSMQPDRGWTPEAVSLAYNLSETYDYFRERHNRDSIDGRGGTIFGFARVGNNFDNAFWTPDLQGVFFGDAQPYAAALDVVAHEYVHGITSHSCGLVYRDQPGALDEAFADIFGEMVEHRTTGATDWKNGTVLTNKRCLQDPASVEILNTGYHYPSKMSDFYSRSHPLLQMLEDQDYGGVHINMTIMSHCFYLLAEGLPGAVGIRDAERIFYRAQTVHLVSNSQFIDMRLACIASAEELFGPDSPQAAKTAEAFDAVEILENAATPQPRPSPAVTGEDNAVFISDDPTTGASYLARYERGLGDGALGRWLSCYDVQWARPAVSGDGGVVFFVDSIQDACFIATDMDAEIEPCEICLDMPGEIHSVAMSADQEVYGFVLLDDEGEPDNAITVVDLRPGGQTRTFPLVATATEGVSLNTVLFADSMNFTSDNRHLVYDAYNVLNFQDGSRIGVWSIYAIDLLTEQTLALVGPFADADVGYPSLGRTFNHLMTFDLLNAETDETMVIAHNLISGEWDMVARVQGVWTVPGYSGDDGAVLYSRPDPDMPTGYSYVRQRLEANLLTPRGAPETFIEDASFAVTYRRGAYTTPTPNLEVSSNSLIFGAVRPGEGSSLPLTLTNSGTGELMIQRISIAGPGAADYQIRGGCAGQRLLSSGACRLFVDFLPVASGAKTATLIVESDDSNRPRIDIDITGRAADGDDGKSDGGCFIGTILNR